MRLLTKTATPLLIISACLTFGMAQKWVPVRSSSFGQAEQKRVGRMENDLFCYETKAPARGLRNSVDRTGDINSADQNGCTPLMRAAENGHHNAVRDLLQKGVAVDTRHRSGVTALMLAARQGHLQIVKMLLDAGADPDIAVVTVHACCATALGYARTYHGPNRRQIVGAMIDAILAAETTRRSKGESGNTSLIYALLTQDAPLVEMLLAKGADVNTKGEHGITPLMVAAGTVNPKLVKALIRAGVDVNARNDEGKTALALIEELSDGSKIKERDEIISLLKQGGATH